MANELQRAARDLERMFGFGAVRKSKRGQNEEPTDEYEQMSDEDERDEDEHNTDDDAVSAQKKAAGKGKRAAAALNKSRRAMEEKDEDQEDDDTEDDEDYEDDDTQKSRRTKKSRGSAPAMDEDDDEDEEDDDDEDDVPQTRKTRKSRNARAEALEDDFTDWEEDIPDEQKPGHEFEMHEGGEARRKTKKSKRGRQSDAPDNSPTQQAIRASQDAYIGTSDEFDYGDEEDVPGQEGVDDDDDTIVTNLGRRLKFSKKSERSTFEPTRERVYKSLARHDGFAEAVEASDALAHMTDVHAAGFEGLYREVRKSRRENAKLHQENIALRKDIKTIAKSLHALMGALAGEVEVAPVQKSMSAQAPAHNPMETAAWGIPPQTPVDNGQPARIAKSLRAGDDDFNVAGLQQVVEKSLSAGYIDRETAGTMMINISSVDGRQMVVNQLQNTLEPRVAKSFGLR